jgi:hypothetical protein
MPTRKIGRDATTGRFISVTDAQEHPATAIVGRFSRVRLRGAVHVSEGSASLRFSRPRKEQG